MKKKPGNFANQVLITAIVAMIAGFLFSAYTDYATTKAAEMPLSALDTVLEEGDIEQVVVKQVSNEVNISFNEGYLWDGDRSFVFMTYPEGYEETITEKLLAGSHNVEVNTEAPGFLARLVNLLPIIFLVFIGWYFFKMMSGGSGGILGSMGKKPESLGQKDMPKVKFTDVAGIDEVIEEVGEIKEFLDNPAKYRELGARIPKGVLLCGNPGTGKTLLARAVAGEAGVPFFSISGSDFVEMFVGVGASRVRKLFEEAGKEGTAIIFIDEIDAVGGRRGAGVSGSNDEREQTLNALLTQMDGFSTNSNVIVIAATNRPDILDPALLRPGRFDRQIIVPIPDVRGREMILEVHSEGKPLAEDVSLKRVAGDTAGFSGADLANLINEAALLSARRGKKFIGMEEIEDSFTRVVMKSPARKNKAMSEDEKKLTAYHEAGHALVGFTLPRVDPVTKISIVSHGSAGGFTMSVPEEDRSYYKRKMLLDKLAMMLGGRAAEEIIFGDDDYSTGASNDIEKATEIAEHMITTYGMSEKLGPLKWNRSSMMESGNYSEETARVIDEEKREIVEAAKDKARAVIECHREALDKMAAVLLEKESVSGPKIDEIFGEDIKNSWEDGNI